MKHLDLQHAIADEAVAMFLATKKITKLEPATARHDPKLGKMTLGYPEKALSDAHIKRRK